MTGLGLDPRIDPVIFVGWLLTGIASFAICYGLPMAGSSPSMTWGARGGGRNLAANMEPTMHCGIATFLRHTRRGRSGRNNTSTKAQPAMAAPARKVAESAWA